MKNQLSTELRKHPLKRKKSFEKGNEEEVNLQALPFVSKERGIVKSPTFRHPWQNIKRMAFHVSFTAVT